MGKTGLVYDPRYLDHDMGAGHPESPARLRAIMQQLERSGTAARLTRIEPREAEDEWITQIHRPSYLAMLKAHTPTNGRVSLDPDTAMSHGSLAAAYLAAGGALAAVDAIVSRQVEHVFCAVRPPGHHAEAGRAMGFCLFNNVAIAARYAQKKHGLKRVLIVDWDVHHGNGTQDVFYEDGSVLFFSTHQHPWYPGTGMPEERGEGKGKGKIMNRPFPAGSGRSQIVESFRRDLLTAATDFKPDLVMVSAGFDSRKGDPLGRFQLTDEDFRDLTLVMMEIANKHAGDRVVSLLEGGYSLTGLASGVTTHLKALASE
jgi:acetoin utilization deacetylase AcuC-like enzyme